MNAITRILTLFSLSLFLLQYQLSAQVFQKSEDSLMLLEVITFPEVNGNFNISFSEWEFDLDYVLEETIDDNQDEQTMLTLLDVDPQDLQLVLKLSDYYKSVNRTEEANTYLNYAYRLAILLLEQQPDSLEIMEQLGTMLFQHNQIELAHQHWKQFVELNPNSARARSRLAQFSYFIQEEEQAMQQLEKAYALDPKDISIYNHLLIQEIFNIIRQMQEFSADDISSYEGINQSFMKIQLKYTPFFDKAIQEHQSVAAQMAKDVSQMYLIFLQTLLGSISEDLTTKKIKFKIHKRYRPQLKGIKKRAKAQLKSDISNKAFAYKMLIILSVFENKTKQVEAYFQAAKAYFEKDAQLLKLLGLSQLTKVKIDRAIPYWEASVVVSEDYEDQLVLGRLYNSEENYKTLETVIKKAKELKPEDPRSSISLAYVYLHQGQVQKALKELEAIQALSREGSEDAYFYQAIYWFIKGDKDKAKLILRNIQSGEQRYYQEPAKELLEYLEQ